jgi:hypothetical protein
MSSPFNNSVVVEHVSCLAKTDSKSRRGYRELLEAHKQLVLSSTIASGPSSASSAPLPAFRGRIVDGDHYVDRVLEALARWRDNYLPDTSPTLSDLPLVQLRSVLLLVDALWGKHFNVAAVFGAEAVASDDRWSTAARRSGLDSWLRERLREVPFASDRTELFEKLSRNQLEEAVELV